MLPNEHLVMATDWFQKSAEMRACYYQAYNLAKFTLKEHYEHYQGKKPTAVVLDIDETILDNSPFEVHLIKTGGSYSGKSWKKWTDQMAAKALPGALDFTLFAKKTGVEVIYISNRKSVEMSSTLKNLQALGFPNADSAFVLLKGPKESGDKTSRREQVSTNYEVLLYIGDNLTDYDQNFANRGNNLGFKLVDEFKDDFGDKFIMLPNPMYGEWEGAIYGNDFSKNPEEKSRLRKEILEGY